MKIFKISNRNWRSRCSKILPVAPVLANTVNFKVFNAKMSLIFQNPGYMKENFVICIESLHVPDAGDQFNVSLLNNVISFF